MSTSASATTVGTSKPKKVNCPRIGLRFRDWRLKGPYDAVVIGSGMGGLTTAAMLSKLGWKVAVLEQHYTAGGYTHSYEREGYEWDVGLHYVGDMDARTQPRKLMDFLTGGRLQWAAMGQVYDRFFIGNKVFDAVAGKQAFRDELVRRFPQEAAAIDRYMALLAQVKKAVPLFTMARLFKPWQRALAKPLLGLMLPRTLSMSTGVVLAEITQNPELIAVLTAQWGDYGLPPSQSSFLIHALVASHYLHGGYYPVGGSWRIAEAILPQIRAAGGEVFTYARVKQIVVEHGQTKGVLMEDGTRINCACVISSAGVVNTFQQLVPAAEVQRAGYETQLKQVKPSAAHLGVSWASSTRQKNWACPRPTSGSTRATITTVCCNASWTIPSSLSPWSTSPSRRPRTRTSRDATRARPPSRSWPRPTTPGSNPGRTPSGASAAKTTTPLRPAGASA